MSIDTERANALLLNGFAPFQFTYSQVVEGADTMLATIVAAFTRYAPELL